MAAVMFLLFGLWMLIDGALGLRWPALAITASVGVAAATAGVVALVRRRRVRAAASAPLETSAERS
jgi:Ca2+/H+ antiporter, TMEM165/GDT1 family